MLQPIEKAIYARYQRTVAISKGAGTALESYFDTLGLNKDVEVIPNGIAPRYFQGARATLARGNGPLKVIAVGTLDSRQNFRDAIAAIELVADAQLTFVGDGPLRRELEEQARDSGLEERVRFEGMTSDPLPFMDSHHVLLSTSRFEGFGLVAAEAMARGCAVIAPNVSGLNDVVLDGVSGLLYPRTDDVIEHIARQLIRLRDDNALYEVLSANALAASNAFSVQFTAESYLDLYRSMLA
jgi:glycosyltransferase involved in cell wall biosynthesis